MTNKSICAVLCIGAFGLACEDKPQPASKPVAESTATAKATAEAPKPEPVKALEGEALAKHYVACWNDFNEGKWDEFGKCYAEDSVGMRPDSGMPDLKGRAAIVEDTKNFKSAFSDAKGTPEVVLVNGREIATVALVVGTNDGAMKNPDGSSMPATNKQTGQHVFHAVTFDDKNQVAKESFVQDIASLMFQLGMSPGPARPAVTEPIAGSPNIIVAKNDDTEKANVELMKKAWDDMAKEDLKALAAMMADDVVEADQGEPADHSGKKDVLASTKMFLGAMGDIKTDCNTWGAGEYAVAQCNFQATNDGDMGKMFKKTGKSVNLTVVEVAQIQEGKVKQLWRFYNGMAFASQLGLIPPPEAAAAATAEGEKKDQPAAATKEKE